MLKYLYKKSSSLLLLSSSSSSSSGLSINHRSIRMINIMKAYYHNNKLHLYRGFNISNDQNYEIYNNNNDNIHDDKVSISIEIIDK